MKKISTAASDKIGKVEGQRLTVGLDVGDRSSWYCVLDEAGAVLLEQKLPTTASGLNPVGPRGLELFCNPSKIVEVSMPHYEFFCQKCKKFFDKILSLVDYEEGEVLCPHCGSKKVEQRWSPFSAITSKKSA